MIALSKPIIGEEEKQAVIRVLDSGMIAQGPEVAAFEDEFYLDLPIRMNWDIIGIGGGTMIPNLRIKDEGCLLYTSDAADE